MRASELREKSPAELETLLGELLRAQFSLRMQKGTGQLSRPTQMTQVRRDIARVKTFITAQKTAQKTAR